MRVKRVPPVPCTRRILPLLAAAAFAVTAAATVTVSHAAGEVRLIRASSSLSKDTAAVGGESPDTNTVQSAYFLILIKNIAYSKSVTLWVRNPANDSAWDTLPCAWVRQADDDNEYWDLSKNFTLGYGLTDPVRDLEFKVRYVEGIHSYWDDNGGRNYKLARDGGSLLNGVNVMLRNASWRADTGQAADSSVFSGQVEVRGYKPGNTLKISFTPDNLKSLDIRPVAGTPKPTWSGTAPVADSDRVYLYDFSFRGIKLPFEANPSLHFHVVYADGTFAYRDDNRAHQYAIGLGMKLENLVYDMLPLPVAMRPALREAARDRRQGFSGPSHSRLFDAGARGQVDGIGRSR